MSLADSPRSERFRSDIAVAEDFRQLRMTRLLDATPEEVFAAFTDPEMIVQWWGPEGYGSDWAELDLRVGGAIRIHMRDLNGDYDGIMAGSFVEIAAPHRLVFRITDHCGGAPEIFDAKAMSPTLVTIALRPVGSDRTELVLTQEGFLDVATKEAHEWGWGGSLDKLTQRMVAASEA